MSNLLRTLNQKPIAYYPAYKDLTGSLSSGILLSQLMYWFSKKDKIYKTDAEITKETHLSEKEIRNAKTRIKKLEFVTVTREGIPAKTFYEIDWDLYETTLDEWAEQDSPKGRNCDSPMVETITESTTETTTKNPIIPSDNRIEGSSENINSGGKKKEKGTPPNSATPPKSDTRVLFDSLLGTKKIATPRSGHDQLLQQMCDAIDEMNPTVIRRATIYLWFRYLFLVRKKSYRAMGGINLQLNIIKGITSDADLERAVRQSIDEEWLKIYVTKNGNGEKQTASKRVCTEPLKRKGFGRVYFLDSKTGEGCMEREVSSREFNDKIASGEWVNLGRYDEWVKNKRG